LIRPAGAETVETFVAADRVVLRATRRPTGRRRAVLVVPGIFMHRDSPEHVAVRERLSAVADVITIDVRGHGDSGGAFTWGVREPEDVAAVAAVLRRDYDRLGGLGFSFGGHHVGMAAARHHAFDAVALVAAPRRLFVLDHNFATAGLLRSVPLMWRRRRRRMRPGLPPRLPGALGGVIDRIAPVPLLVAQGTADWLIPGHHAQALFARAGEPKELAMLAGALHAENMLLDDPEPLLSALVAFFAARL